MRAREIMHCQQPFNFQLLLIFLLLSILCGFHIMNSNPSYLLIPLDLPSALAPSPLPNQKQIKKKQKKNLVVEAVVWPTESHSSP